MESQAKPSDRFIPYYIYAFFLFLTIVLGIFIWLSIRDYPGEVTDEAYKKGLHYNSDLEKANAQEKLGWHSKTAFITNNLDVQIMFTLTNKENKPIKDAATTVWFVRSTHAGRDVKISLTPDKKGNYTGKTSLAWKGEWEVYVSATYNGHNYQSATMLYLR